MERSGLEVEEILELELVQVGDYWIWKIMKDLVITPYILV